MAVTHQEILHINKLLRVFQFLQQVGKHIFSKRIVGHIGVGIGGRVGAVVQIAGNGGQIFGNVTDTFRQVGEAGFCAEPT